MLSDIFVSAGKELNTFKKPVAAPYVRKAFSAKGGKATLTVTCSGFYRAFFNGKEITRSILAPYITNPDLFLFYDRYELDLAEGENVVGFILGNGLSNSLDYNVWQFENAAWRSAPKLAFAVEGKDLLVEADGSKTHPSHVVFDDFHGGEWIDRRKEIPDFSSPEYDDSDWKEVLSVQSPKGEKILSSVPPIVSVKEIKPVSIKKIGGGHAYDFGVITAGNMRLKLKAPTAGQEIKYVHTEVTKDGIPNIKTLVCGRMNTNQTYKYVARGDEEEVYEPYFSFVGCRYLFVEGLRDDQATEDAFTFVVQHGECKEWGNFSCSDEVANKIEEIIKNSDMSNLFYFPTDCPQREKNGWTGDASMSAEHMLANFDITRQLTAWEKLIVKTQRADGALPGIVPTDKWGYLWGNGPVWDSVMFTLPYELYRITGDKKLIEYSAEAMLKYLRYAQKKLNPEGLADFGLSDWVQPHCTASGHYAIRKVANTLNLIETTQKAKKMFDVIGDEEKSAFAEEMKNALVASFRKRCFNPRTGVVKGNTQTTQAYPIYLGILTPEEEEKALHVLLGCIKRDEGTLNAGMLGVRYLFHALSKMGKGDLAYELITQNKHPSYGYMIANGATSLWEDFAKVATKENGDLVRIEERQKLSQMPTLAVKIRMLPEALHFRGGKEGRVWSLNHHFLGDVSNWFKRCVVGICVNDGFTDPTHVDVKPDFIDKLTFAEATRETPFGKITVRWERQGKDVMLDVATKGKVRGMIALPEGYSFEDGATKKEIDSGKYLCLSDR